MTTRTGVAPIAPWVGVAVALLFALHDRFELVENRILILIGFAVAAAGIALRVRDARTGEAHSADARALRRRTLIAVALLGAASVALVVARAIASPKLGLRDDVLAALVPPLLGWGVFLLLPIGLAPRPATAPSEPGISRRALVLLAGATFVTVWLATAARTHFDNIDEVLYALQANRFAIGHATWALDPALQRFVKLPLMVVTPEGIHSLYPPGYPAILALFVRFGVPSLCGATLGTLAVVATQRLGARVAAASVGALAAVLLATNPIFLRWSAMYMSHVAGMAAACAAAWLLLGATERSDRRRDLESLLAGLLLGVAFAVRPVTGLAIGLSIWLSLFVRRLGWPRFRRVTVMMCVGAALPFAATLAYNAVTNGDPFRLGYHAALGHLNDVGFGTRGIILYDRDVQPVVSAAQFTFADAVRNEIAFAAWPIARDLFPLWWLLPLVAVAVVYRMRVRWAIVAAFLVLPTVNFFFFGNAERMYVELLPFALVGAALVVRRVRQDDPRAARALVVFLVGANVVTSATRIAGDRWQRTRREADGVEIVRALRDSSRVRSGVLVFVRNPPLSEPLLIGLTQFNFGRFPGPVVVARDLGAENAQLACRLPGYRVLVAETGTRRASPLPERQRARDAAVRSTDARSFHSTRRMTHPTEGSIAPDFTLDTDAGTPLTLSALRGRPVVLFFYPKDDTPGCTIESCEFRDLMPRFKGVKAEVLGISPDDVKSHVKFRKKFDLPYSLLADVEHAVADAYGVWQEKSMFGHKYWGNARTTFVIDQQGRIAKVFEKVKPEGHAAEVAKVVAAL